MNVHVLTFLAVVLGVTALDSPQPGGFSVEVSNESSELPISDGGTDHVAVESNTLHVSDGFITYF